jgi:tetratricopeptide (TPR) repeat protein
MHKFVGPLVALFGMLAGPVCAQPKAISLKPCDGKYDFSGTMDYHDTQNQERIRGIEHNHLNSDVENLVKGQTTAAAGGDLRFIVVEVPNHPRALAALMRLALREHTEMPAESGPYTVRCWLERATVFSPSDGTPFLLSGVYLASNGLQQEALTQLKQAARLLPDNAEVEYNLGLVYLNLHDYDAAHMHAQRAYDLGFPLPGLRRRLAEAGFPLD